MLELKTFISKPELSYSDIVHCIWRLFILFQGLKTDQDCDQYADVFNLFYKNFASEIHSGDFFPLLDKLLDSKEPVPGFLEKILSPLSYFRKEKYLILKIGEVELERAKVFYEKSHFTQEQLDELCLDYAENAPSAYDLFFFRVNKISPTARRTVEVMHKMMRNDITLDALTAVLPEIDIEYLFRKACEQRRLGYAKLLIINPLSEKTKNAALEAILLFPHRGNTQFLEMLKKHKVNFSLLFGNKFTPLFVSLKSQNFAVVEWLLNQKMDLNLNQIADGETVLSKAILFYPQIVDQLLERGADPDLPDGKPLENALFYDRREVVAKLLTEGATLNRQMIESRILKYLQSYIHPKELKERIKYLISLIDNQKLNSIQILKAAISARNIALLTYLVKLSTPACGVNFLGEAINAGDLSSVIALINAGVDPKINHSQMLVRAVLSKNPSNKIVSVLLDCGLDSTCDGYLLPLKALEGYQLSGNFEYLDICELILLKMIPEKSYIFALADELIKDKIEIEEIKQNVLEIIENILMPAKRLAFRLHHHQYEWRKQAEEYAGEDSLVANSNHMFENIVKPLLYNAFSSYPGDELKKVVAIEAAIRHFLLDEMLEIGENEPFRLFVGKNRQVLVQAVDRPIMDEMRKLISSYEDNFRVAWRAYDRFAPHDPEWENLLTSSTPEGFECRKRMAYYFLAIDSLNVPNFIQQLADIRRAHPHPTLDSPSCYPGTISRIGKMGEGHARFTLPLSQRDTVRKQMTKFILAHFSQMIESQSELDSNALYNALVMLNARNAIDVLNDHFEYEDLWVPIRQKFIESLILKLESVNAPVLHPQNRFYFEHESIDISGSGRAIQLGEILKRNKPILKENLPASKQILNPYVITENIRITNNQLDKRLLQFIEFELLFPVVLQFFPESDFDLLKNFVKDLVDNAVALKSISLGFDETILNYEFFQNKLLKEQLVTASSFHEKNEAKLQEIENLLGKILQGSYSANFSQVIEASFARVSKEIRQAQQSRPSMKRH